MSEHEIQKQIMRELSIHHCTVFRANVGKIYTQDGRMFDTGLPVGFPDLVGYRWSDNKIFFRRSKNKNRTNKSKTNYISSTFNGNQYYSWSCAQHE